MSWLRDLFTFGKKESASMQMARSGNVGIGDARFARQLLSDAVEKAAESFGIGFKPGGIQLIQKALLEAVDPGSIQNLDMMAKFKQMMRQGNFQTNFNQQQPVQVQAIDPAQIAMIANVVGQILDSRGLSQQIPPQNQDHTSV